MGVRVGETVGLRKREPELGPPTGFYLHAKVKEATARWGDSPVWIRRGFPLFGGQWCVRTSSRLLELPESAGG